MNQNVSIIQLYRTNGSTKRYEYIGENIQNAKATFILYYLYSTDKIRVDHDCWKLAICTFSSSALLNEHEFYTIDSFEMNQLKKHHPEYTSLFNSFPDDIDDITVDNKIYDDYKSILDQHEIENYGVEITNQKNLSIDELIQYFDNAENKLMNR